MLCWYSALLFLCLEKKTENIPMFNLIVTLKVLSKLLLQFHNLIKIVQSYIFGLNWFEEPMEMSNYPEMKEFEINQNY